MPKLVFPISSQYVPHWGIWECMREVLQNAKDEEDQRQHSMSVEWKNGWLEVSNLGANMGTDALLLGLSDKVGKDLRGQFGEGLNLALLAAARDGYELEVHTMDEVWKPSLTYAVEYGNNRCLTVSTRAKRTKTAGVMVRVKIVEEEWLKMRGLFLFLEPSQEHVETEAGTLLLEEKHRGMIFAKGIFVAKGKTPDYGFDLKNVRLDRDRRMVDQWDLEWQIAKMVKQAVAAQPERFARRVMDLLSDDSPLVEGLYHQIEKADATLAAIKTEFVAAHGATALPVRSMSESEKMAHHGRKGVVVSRSLMSVLEKAFGNKYEIEDSLKATISERHSFHDLTAEEAECLLSARAWLQAQTRYDLETFLEELEVVTFVDDKYEGRANLETGKMELSRKVLSDEYHTLQVLVHELAHVIVRASDGTKAHVNAIEELWMATFRASVSGRRLAH